MKKNSLFFLIVLTVSVLFYGCKDEKDKSIYDSYPDNSENNDEGGCGVIPDENTEKPDTVVDKNETPDEMVENDLDSISDPDSFADDTSDPDIDTETADSMEDVDIIDDSDSAIKECPDDMVENGSSCIDRYEASKKDATATSQGVDESVAVSKPGVLPWMVNPMNSANYEKFKAACTAAGKHLCTDDEWLFSCEGAEKRIYSWGADYNREICNSVDAFCDEYCESNSIAPESCSLNENCGYSYSCFDVAKTGDFLNCKNHSGAFDINGNVWEITDTVNSYMTRGGAYNCASPSSRLTCQYNATWAALFAGFRCCKEK